ncbi:class I SAM-dependent methyltransferase [Pseudoalteromonas viridis]|uniref:Class I SAM-dependent methyltransferase n=1 Tax=Pseudoalteromonas viridis TaxID=339617 RepID=A0ABX7V3B5_9GAMM|nr:class I SAM-dependent methyltransferase [Pseudoalteromonas viridis]QTL34232.1 class I SAM-dependent methyltransferase [Pseudoalteromonas viridis]
MNPNELRRYYQERYKQFGNDPASVQHVSKASQDARFRIIQQYMDKEASILDLGCGLGDMLKYIRMNGHTGCYLGCDFVPEFIESALSTLNWDKKSQFRVFDIEADTLPGGYDFIVMSGIFNNRLENNEAFLYNTLKKTFASANKGVIFNLLSTYVEFEDPELFYISPLDVFDFCKRQLTPYVTLKHNYVTKPGGFPYEYTMVLHKDGEGA